MKKIVRTMILVVLLSVLSAVQADTTGYGYFSGDYQGTLSRDVTRRARFSAP